jgi:hypothetical protein
MEQAEVAHFHKTIGQDMLEEAPDKLEGVKLGRTEAGTAHFPVGKRDRALRERDDAVVRDGDLEDIGGEVGKGRGAVVVGLTVDVPGDRPDLRIDVLQQTGVAHLVFEERTGDGREGFDGDKEVGAGRTPGRAVCGEATAGHKVMDVGVVLELPAPGMQDISKPREIGPDETLIFGEPFKGLRRGCKQSVVRKALMRADKRT